MSTDANVDQWLVRTAENFIAGPYTREQIRQLIRENQLGIQDEVCQGNHYWIHLHERDEVAQQLGSDAALWLGEIGEERTLTQTEPSIEEIQATEAMAEGLAQEGEDSTVIASLPSNAIRLRERRPGGAAGAFALSASESPVQRVHVSPSGHTRSPRIILWLALTVSVFLLFLLLHLSRPTS